MSKTEAEKRRREIAEEAMNQPRGERPKRSKTAAERTAITSLEQMRTEMQELHSEMDQSGAREIDPNRIRESKFSQRSDAAWEDQRYFDLIESMKAKGWIGTMMVRPVPDDDPNHDYEVVFGHRRRRAAIEVGINVRAIVREIDDEELVSLMEVENEGREDPSLYEMGTWYLSWIEHGICKNQSQVAERAHKAGSFVSRAITVAKWPNELIEAFGDSRKIGSRAVSQIQSKLSKADGKKQVLAAAKELSQDEKRHAMSAAEITRRLTAEPEDKPGAAAKPDRSGEVGDMKYQIQTTKQGITARFDKVPEHQKKNLMDRIEQAIRELKDS